jgi:hypothetical protein
METEEVEVKVRYSTFALYLFWVEQSWSGEMKKYEAGKYLR